MSSTRQDGRQGLSKSQYLAVLFSFLLGIASSLYLDHTIRSAEAYAETATGGLPPAALVVSAEE